ncbi:MAG TPA: hypothetical protein VIF43_01080 [Patescibacteria group bacterium]|jgi:hypothetical protein
MKKPEDYYRFDIPELLAAAGGARDFSPAELVRLPNRRYLPGGLFESIVSGDPRQGYLDVDGINMRELHLDDWFAECPPDPRRHGGAMRFVETAADTSIEAQLSARRILFIRKGDYRTAMICGVYEGEETVFGSHDLLDGYGILLPERKSPMAHTEDVGHEVAHTFLPDETTDDQMALVRLQLQEGRGGWIEEWCEAFMRFWLAQPGVRERLYHFLYMHQDEEKIVLTPV